MLPPILHRYRALHRLSQLDAGLAGTVLLTAFMTLAVLGVRLGPEARDLAYLLLVSPVLSAIFGLPALVLTYRLALVVARPRRRRLLRLRFVLDLILAPLLTALAASYFPYALIHAVIRRLDTGG